MPPTLSMTDALDQIRWSKENGAVAVCLRPVEGNRLLADSYFYPLYETAEKLDMAIAIHIANGSAWLKRSLSSSGGDRRHTPPLPHPDSGFIQRYFAKRDS
jgi:predicted TIM-barrel fold metal-dependent hydrolase